MTAQNRSTVPGNDQHFSLKQLYAAAHQEERFELTPAISVYIRPNPAEVETTNPRRKSRKSHLAGAESDEDRAPEEGDIWWIGRIQEIRAQDERNVYM